ncbi:MAG: wapP [Gammaproteobacteria bacterium]|jgi:hypothetical protein|nr:wapP [Gammaproteobacteria bacterium]
MVKLHFAENRLSKEERQRFATSAAIKASTSAAKLVSEGPYNRMWYLETSSGQNYYIKIYHRRGRYLRKYCARSRARGEWENLQYFKKNNLPIPEVLVYGESTRRKQYEGGFLVQREISSSQNLSHIAQVEPQWHTDFSKRLEVLLKLVAYLRQLHAKRFIHKDFKWRNFMVKWDDPMEVYLIDCPVGQRHLSFQYGLGWWRDLRDFDEDARRYLSRSDRLRLYLAYKQRKMLTRKDKQVITKICKEKKS